MTPPHDPLADFARLIPLIAGLEDPAAPGLAEALARWPGSRTATLEAGAGWASNVRATSMQRAPDAALQRLAHRSSALSGRPLAEEVHRVVGKYEASESSAF